MTGAELRTAKQIPNGFGLAKTENEALSEDEMETIAPTLTSKIVMPSKATADQKSSLTGTASNFSAAEVPKALPKNCSGKVTFK